MRLDFGISQGKGTTHVHVRYENNFNDHIINNYLHFIENKEEERYKFKIFKRNIK